ncbi:MAG: hypothetical protein HQ592_00350 [Planctomycetes bacterium]|nr:hypothetical protein [Planctomycetota bacterium]
MKWFILLSLILTCGCGDNTSSQEEVVIVAGPDGGESKSLLIAPVIVEAEIIGGGDGDKYYYYDITVVEVIKNSISVKLDSPMKVARANYEPQPDLNRTYFLDLDYYNEAHPEYGLKIVSFKIK